MWKFADEHPVEFVIIVLAAMMTVGSVVQNVVQSFN